MVTVTISLGSNCGDRRRKIEEALAWLKSILLQFKSSEIYETDCAMHSGKPYLNAVVTGFYQGDGIELGDRLKDKEREMGRDARCRENGDVPIDMDILICNGEVIKEWDFRQKFFKTGFEEISN